MRPNNGLDSGRRPLRILQVVSSSATSGAEQHALTLSSLLRGLGHYVEVVCPPGWLAEELRAAGVPTHSLAMKGRSTVAAHAWMLRKVRRERFDLMHAHLTRATYLGVVSGSLRRVPLVTSVHIASRDHIYRLAARRTNRVVAVSNFVRGMLHGLGVPERYIDVVYNGTDFADFRPQRARSVRSEFHIPRGRKLIGLVGRVCREKGHMMAVDAMPQVLDEHPSAHLLFVGRFESEFEPEIRHAVSERRLDERVTFTGNRRDVARLLDAMSFTILPSAIEACPLAALEAMARARPLVATRVGGLAELVVHEQTGLLVDGNPEDLADGMSYLTGNDFERERMGANARKLIEEKFTLNQMVERLEAVYERAASA